MQKTKFFVACIAIMLTQASTHAVDWPMLAHDAARSGSTTAEVPPPADRAWLRYFHMEGLMPTVQPVVKDSRVYFGTLAGFFYCLDSETGADIWKVNVGAPVFHTACITRGDKVVFGTGDGRILALDAASGKTVWNVSTDTPLWNAPLEHDGRVVIGGRDSVLYALHAETGELAWTYRAEAPFYQSPTLDENRGMVYITSEDMRLHAVHFADGKGKWISEPMNAATARSCYPVIAPDGTVMVPVLPYLSWGDAAKPYRDALKILFGTEELKQGEGAKYDGEYARIPKEWRLEKSKQEEYAVHAHKVLLEDGYFDKMQAVMKKGLQEIPGSRGLYIFNPETGQEQAYAPVGYTAFAKSQFHPPLVTPQGRVITKWLAAAASTFYSYQPKINLAYLDTQTGRLSPVFDESRVSKGFHPLGLIADEGAQLSVAGKYLLALNAHHGEVFRYQDLSDAQKRTFGTYYQTHSHSYGVGIIHRLVRGEIDEINRGQEDIPRGFGCGVPGQHATGNHTAFNSPAVVAANKIFWMAAGKLLVLKHADEPSETLKPESNKRSLAEYDIAPLTAEEKSTIYNEWPVNWDLVPRQDSTRKVEYVPEDLGFPEGTRQNPDEKARKNATVSAELVNQVIWESWEPGRLEDNAETVRLQTALNAAVAELISTELWQPFRFMGGKHPREYLEFFADPTDTVLALAWAWPFLNASMQAETMQWMEQHMKTYAPLSRLEKYASGKGTAREYYRVDETGKIEKTMFPLERSLHGERGWAAWLWAHRTGRWDMIDDEIYQATADSYRSPTVREKWEVEVYQSSRQTDWKNACIASMIAACRMAEHRGDAETLSANREVLAQVLQERLGQALAYSRGFVADDTLSQWRTYARWTHLTPEVGRFLALTTAGSEKALVKKHLGWMMPYWFLTWGPLVPSGLENSVQLPVNNVAGFKAHAFIEKASPADLANWVDVPAGKADVFYIQKLGIALTALSNPTWKDMRKATFK